jgi:hypothetical protein
VHGAAFEVFPRLALALLSSLLLLPCIWHQLAGLFVDPWYSKLQPHMFP